MNGQHRNRARTLSSVEVAHAELIDQVVELDDELMEIYLEQGEKISPDQLHDPFEKALRRGHLFKINVDPYLGRVGIFRAHQGTIRSGDQVYVGERRKSFKVFHLYRL